MSNPNYTLEVISHHQQFKNKSLRKYYVDGIETVGAWGDEPFEIRFKNNTWQKVQVKISLDGTDVFTGEPATTDVSPNMWVVQPYASMSLKAWPETNNGGAGFIFTSADNSVAGHTHGDLTSRGIIAAAVFTEGHVEPLRVDPHPWCYTSVPILFNDVYKGGNTLGGYGTIVNNTTFTGTVSNNVGTLSGGGGTYSSSCIPAAAGGHADGRRSRKSLEGTEIGEESATADINTLVSVGAGAHVDQHITYVTGLTKPLLSETVRVKYLWWDDLVAKLKEANVAAPHPSGFPGDGNKTNIDLKDTPRKVGSFRRAKEHDVLYHRV